MATKIDEFDRMFKKIVRVVKEMNLYSGVHRWLLYKQSYEIMRKKFINGIDNFDRKVNGDDFFTHIWAFEPAWKEWGYSEYVSIGLEKICKELRKNYGNIYM